MKLLKHPVYYILVVFIIIGFYFRLTGILQIHSFWSDEAYIASIARNFANNNISINSVFSNHASSYQSLYVFLLSSVFKLFGANELVARIPSVIFGTVSIFLSYIVTSRFSTKYGGLITAFLTAFAQIFLVYSTMARPYIIFTTLLLSIIFALQLLDKKKSPYTLKIHSFIIITLILSFYLHLSGLLFFSIYISYLSLRYIKNIFLFIKNDPLYTGIVFVVVGLLFILIKGYSYIMIIGEISKGVNNITYFRELFAKQYLFISLPALFGLIFIFNQNKRISIGLVVWIGLLVFAWNFVQYSHNIRYLVPLFSIMFVFFGTFWGTIIDTFFKKNQLIICLLIIGFLYAGGYKLVRKPSPYYNPNQDLIGDVQNANYKEVYIQLKTKFPNIAELTIFNNVIDTQSWYLPEKPDADIYFIRDIKSPHKHILNNVPIYGNLNDFKKLQEQYPQGILIVEDWHSFLPEDIKTYAKTHMKREIRVEGLQHANGDNWPVEVYSWGL